MVRYVVITSEHKFITERYYYLIDYLNGYLKNGFSLDKMNIEMINPPLYLKSSVDTFLMASGLKTCSYKVGKDITDNLDLAIEKLLSSNEEKIIINLKKNPIILSKDYFLLANGRYHQNSTLNL